MVRIARLARRIRTDISDSELVHMLLTNPCISWNHADLRMMNHSQQVPEEFYDPAGESKYLRRRYGQSIF